MEMDLQVDIVFLIETTSMNGMYINEMKTNYIQPILEHFNQGCLDNTDSTCENKNCFYSVILYNAADIRPQPCCRAYGQEKDPQFVLSVIEKVRYTGGKSHSSASVGEGLATCLQFFDDIKKNRDSCQKHCVLVCNSPPNQMPVMENEQYAGNTLDQLAALFIERKIFLSIISPRKIPPLFKLFEKTGGDLTQALSKTYSKSTRNLVLLNGICLKERAVSPSNVAPLSNNLSAASPKPVPANVGSPNPSVTFRQNNMAQAPTGSVDIPSQQQLQNQQQQQTAQQALPQQSHHPQQPNVQLQQQASQGQPQLQPQQPQTNQQVLLQQPIQHPSQSSQMMGPSPQNQMNAAQRPVAFVPPNQMNFSRGPVPQGKWVQQPRPFNPTPQQSALIAQLQQPITSMPPQFAERYGGPAMNQGNLINQLPNQQVPFQHQIQQSQQQQQPSMRMVTPSSGIANAVQSGSVNPQVSSFDPSNAIWRGILEWSEKTKSPNSITRQVPCHVTPAPSKDKENDVKADMWPSKLNMQLLPRNILLHSNQEHLKQSTSVCFNISDCEATMSLKQSMMSGFAGCVQFTPPISPADLRVLILLYTPDKDLFVGFIPIKQAAFIENLRKQIQNRRNQANSQTQMQNQQGQNTTGSQTGTGPSGMPQHMGGMIQSGNVNTMIGQQPPMGMPPAGSMIRMGNQQIIHQNSNAMRGSNAGLNQRLGVDPETDRQKNLVQIQLLKQQLDAAQQQEQMFSRRQQMEQPQIVGHQFVNVQTQQQNQQGRSHVNTMPLQGNPQFDDSSYPDFMG